MVLNATHVEAISEYSWRQDRRLASAWAGPAGQRRRDPRRRERRADRASGSVGSRALFLRAAGSTG